MLRDLKIKNLAIIDDLTISFARGLNVLTGETGAGKSIIVDAMGLVLGDRAQSEMVRSGEKEAVVQAFFDIEPESSDRLQDIDISDGLIIRRSISPAGKSRAHINDDMVTLQALSSIGRLLVDIQGQHEHQTLASPERQCEVIDAYGKLANEKAATAQLYADLRNLREDLAKLTENPGAALHRRDLLRYQTDEIESADVSEGEYEMLAEEIKVLSNTTRLNELSGKVYSALYESEGSCLDLLSKAAVSLREMTGIDGSLSEPLQNIEAALPLISEASITVRNYRDRLDSDPERLDKAVERLENLRTLRRKYGSDEEEILKYLAKAKEELQSLDSVEEKAAMLEAEVKKKEEELLAAATKLSARRKSVSEALQSGIREVLAEVALQNALFTINIAHEKEADGRLRIGPSGMDKVEFMFTANPGEPLKPLAKTASGGELSRVMLAIKSVLADADDIPVLIFDEVDAGVGGKTAEHLGRLLKALAADHQVLCITHLAQIASFGDRHLRIEKKIVEGRVKVAVHELCGEERHDEIARMLGGTVTEISRMHAGELLSKEDAEKG